MESPVDAVESPVDAMESPACTPKHPSSLQSLVSLTEERIRVLL